MSPAEDALLEAIRRGDRRAFAQAVSACQSRVRSFAASFLGDGTMGDDVAQQAFLDLWRDRAKLEPGRSLLAHVLVRARHLCLHRVRSARRERLRLQGLHSEPVQDTPTPLEAFLGEERVRAEGRARARLAEMIDGLDEEARTAIWMRLTGASFDEISAAVGKPAHAVRALVYRRLAEIQKRMEDCET